jgi:Xaa-Pro aminopeptidase
VLSANNERARLADEELSGLPFRQVEYPWDRPDRARAILAQAAELHGVVSDLGMLGLDPAPTDLAELRYTLSEGEIDRYRDLGTDAARAVETAAREARSGDSELEVAGRLAFECRRRGILPLVVLVAFDERIARYRHPIPTRNRFRSTALVALTGRRHGLHASMTRMVTGDLDRGLAARHLATARVDARVVRCSRPGRTLGTIFEEAVDQYRLEGFPEEWRLHHQGGLTGYAGREIFAVSGQEHVLGAGQALSWNPSITGAKSEDTILVTDAGPEVLTRTGEWPEITVETEAGRFERPAVLEGGSS